MIRIIGGGLSGLFAAYAFKKAGYEVELFEKSGRLGGLVHTLHMPWGLVETAANGMLNSAQVEELSRDIGVEFCGMQKTFRKRYIYRERPRRMPLSSLETLRFSVGLLRRQKPYPSETLWDYSHRVFGAGATRYLVEPAVMGVFGVSAMALSASLVYDYFFKFRSMQPAGQRGTVAPVKGMGALVDGLADWLKKSGVRIHLSAPVEVAPDHHNVVATDALTASRLLQTHAPVLSGQLAHVQYQALYSVTLGFDSPGALKGFGCLFPRTEGFKSLGVLFNSYIFAERGPLFSETWVVPAQNLNENTVFAAVQADRKKLLGLDQAPQHKVVTHWAQALPIYDAALERTLRSLTLPTYVDIIGNYTGRLGLSKILDQAFELAKKKKESA